MRRSKIARQMGVKYPFVGAGMAIVGGPELTAGVSNAGGVGLYCMGPGAPDRLGAAIDDIRRRTTKPFGVDFIVEETGFGPATTDAHIDIAVNARIPLAVFFWNPPEGRWVEALKKSGAKIWGTAWSVESAVRLAALGADAIIAQTSEAGGHVRATLSASSLIPAIVDVVSIPIIAAGGIVDARTATAAFALGADAICVGTRLVASRESLASDDYKKRILAATGEDTTITDIFGPEWPGAPMRVIRNRAVERAEKGEAPPAGSIGETRVFGEPYQMPPHSAVLPTRETKGDHEEMCLAAGAGVGSVRDIKPAAAIVMEIMRGA